MKITYFRIALRNILKNKRRSLVTISAIAFGFAALALFNGYTTDVFKQLGYSAVIQEGLGHLTIYKRGWLEQGTLYPEKYVFTKEEYEKIIADTEAIPGVVRASPKLNVSGLVSNGRVSTIFIAEGTVPEHYNTLIHMDDLVVRDEFDPKDPSGVQLSEGLAQLLGFEVGSKGTLSSVTLESTMNAVNMEVARTFNTGIPETNDKFVRMPLRMAQELFDAERADRVMLILDSFERTDSARDAVAAKLTSSGLDVEVKTWQERSAFYRSTKALLSMLLTFMGTIVLIIVVMSIVNTMGVSVLERTREIGTLRVLGLKRREAAWLFACEGVLLGLLGSAVGTVLHTLAWVGIRIAEPKYMPPGNSEYVLFAVRYVPGFVAGLTIAMLIFAFAAAILPARRAAQQNVVVSLGFV
jgi:putative ABC transport system permease protein